MKRNILKYAFGKNANRQKNLLILFLVVVELMLVVTAGVSYGNKNLDKYTFSGKDLKDNKLLAVMVENSSGNYEQSTLTTFPGYEYFYNPSKSGCMSTNGKQIADSLLYDQDNKKATVKTTSASICYLYFDKYKTTTFADQLIASGNLWQSGLEGDGYRYVGQGVTCSYDNGNLIDVANNQNTTPTCPKKYNYTRTTVSSGDTRSYTYQTSCPSNTSSYTYSCTELQGNILNTVIPDNFICFGTADASECTANQDKYMYRVLGVFSDANGENHVKLIKYKQLGSAYKWDTNYKTDISWENSGMYKGLSGSYFLTNTTYDYLQNTSWSNRIENWTWSAVNTKTYSNSGPDYYDITAQEIYLHEMNRSTKISTVGEWTTPSAKIGLMYVSDYALSLGSSALALTSSSNDSVLKTGWMHQSNNDTTKGTYEWTLSRRGASGSSFYAWRVRDDGSVDLGVNSAYGVRPVFYLTSDVTSSGGTGTLEDPFIIDTSSRAKLSVSTSASGSTLTAKITKGTGNLNKYCINNKASINECEWKNITSTTITYDMPEETTYYVHVIDDAGYIAHSSYNYKTWDSNLTLTENLIKYGNLWQSELEGDGYRFVGTGEVGTSTNPDNFICFGTTDVSECTADQDKYMYRIIGVFSDENGISHVKLIKYKHLITISYPVEYLGSNWGESYYYTTLNGDEYLSNTTYDYFQNTIWSDKMVNWTWKTVNTKTSEDTNNNVNYEISGSFGIYLNEMNINVDDSVCSSDQNSGISCNNGEWSSTSGYIGLMYVSDYTLAIGEVFQYYSNSDVDKYNTGWISPLNNDASTTSDEYTISRSNDSMWYIGSLGIKAYQGDPGTPIGIRPVFYLASDVVVSSGTGSLTDPYMIAE